MVVHLGSVYVKVKGHSGKPQTGMPPCWFPLGFLPTEPALVNRAEDTGN